MRAPATEKPPLSASRPVMRALRGRSAAGMARMVRCGGSSAGVTAARGISRGGGTAAGSTFANAGAAGAALPAAGAARSSGGGAGCSARVHQPSSSATVTSARGAAANTASARRSRRRAVASVRVRRSAPSVRGGRRYKCAALPLGSRMHHHILRVCFLMALGSTATAQWSNNPAQNSAIGDLPGDQAVPKIAATAGGGCYIGWFDNSGSGYQVRLQRLDVGGHEQWPHNGTVVSSNPQNSSLVGWELIADSQGDCVLTFTDIRSGPDLDVYAYRIDPSGAQLWGANGVTLSSNADSENNPKVCETSAGMFAFAWSNNTGFTVRVQMLTAGGVPLFAQDGIGIAADAGANPGFVGLVPSH